MHIRNKTGRYPEIIRSDNGREFTDNRMVSLCEEKGIERQYTPQQNGVAERNIQTIQILETVT